MFVDERVTRPIQGEVAQKAEQIRCFCGLWQEGPVAVVVRFVFKQKLCAIQKERLCSFGVHRPAELSRRVVFARQGAMVK